MFQGYEMKFSKSSILYRLESTGLIKTKFNYLIKGLDNGDMKLINELLCKINPKLKVGGKDIYMNSRNFDFLDIHGKPTVFQPLAMWSIQIAIQGYKSSPAGIITPIWKINDAQMIE